MPNYVTNVLTVERGEYDLSNIKSFSDLLPIPESFGNTSQDVITMMIEDILSVGKSVNFTLEEINNKIKELCQGDLSKESYEQIKRVVSNIKEHGFASSYKWCIYNWGTKWDMDIIHSSKNTLVFQTAWSAPISWLERLSKEVPNDVVLQLEWADEDFGCNTGCAIVERNEFNAIEDEDESQQAYSRAVALQGQPENLVLIDDEWVWLTNEELEDFEG